LASATATATKGNSFYGLAIGGTVAVGAAAAGAVSGGAFHPAGGGGAAPADAVAGGPAGHGWVHPVGPRRAAAPPATASRYRRPGASTAAACRLSPWASRARACHEAHGHV